MKNNIFFKALTVLTVLGLINISCSKERLEDETPSLNSYTETSNYLASKKQQEQVYTVDSPATGPIIAQQGTQMWPHKEIFMFPNGDDVHYPFEIRIIEIYKPIDMVYSQMPTVSDGKLLITGGEIRVKAFKDGQELVLRPMASIRLDFPTNSADNNMRVFYGQESGSVVNWIEPNDSVQVTSSFYQVYSHRMNWINCDYFADYSGTLSSFNLTSTTEDITTLAKFIYFDGLHSMMQIYSMPSAMVLVGEDIKVIFIGKNSAGELFHYYSDTIVTTNNNYEVSLTQISEADLDALLNSL